MLSTPLHSDCSFISSLDWQQHRHSQIMKIFYCVGFTPMDFHIPNINFSIYHVVIGVSKIFWYKISQGFLFFQTKQSYLIQSSSAQHNLKYLIACCFFSTCNECISYSKFSDAVCLIKHFVVTFSIFRLDNFILLKYVKWRLPRPFTLACNRS